MPVAKRKYGGVWKDATIEKEWDDGYCVVRVRTFEDLYTLSKNGGGCSLAHSFWTDIARPIGEYFFVLMKPDKTIGPILFCKLARYRGKKHPQEDKFLTWHYEEKKRNERYNYGSPIASDYYDRFGVHSYAPDVGHLEDQLAHYKEKYQHYKRLALEHGPLGPDNPYKHHMDDANRRAINCNKWIDNAKARARLQPGDEFTYKTIRLFLIQLAGRGINYDGRDDRYVPKLMEFMRKRPNGTT